MEYQWQAPLPSDAAIHIDVFAATREKNVGMASVQVEHRPTALTSGRVHLIASGVSQYRDASIPPLDFADDNAKRFAEALHTFSPRGFRGQQQLLTDQNVTPANWRMTVANMRRELRDRVQPDDVLLVFLSGHGIQDPVTGEYRYLTYRARSRDLRARNYVDCLDFLSIASLGDLPCRKLVILDTCHSGAIQSMEASQLKSAVRFLQSDMAIVFTASEGTQFAIEDRERQSGAFTYWVNEGLRGNGDLNRDGAVSLKELVGYVQSKMAVESVSQHPTIGPTRLYQSVDFT